MSRKVELFFKGRLMLLGLVPCMVTVSTLSIMSGRQTEQKRLTRASQNHDASLAEY